jgi:hypothetical protein
VNCILSYHESTGLRLRRGREFHKNSVDPSWNRKCLKSSDRKGAVSIDKTRRLNRKERDLAARLISRCEKTTADMQACLLVLSAIRNDSEMSKEVA